MIRIWLFLAISLSAQETPPEPEAPVEDHTAAPRVVSIEPSCDSTDVDPSLKEIRVTFDMPMNHEGYSFVGGGSHFPTPVGPPRWVDARTCVLPVTLTPDREYRFGINSADYQNFRSVWLVPAEAVACSFTTGGIAKIERTPEEQRRLNVTSFDALADAIRSQYAYFELRKIDWEQLLADNRVEVVSQASTAAWARQAARMIAAAGDIHLALEYDGDITPTFVRDVKPNFAWDGVRRIVPSLERHGQSAATGYTREGFAYVFIGSWESEAGGDVRAVEAFLAESVNASGVIIDVRANAGGSEELARSVAAWFVDGPSVYAKHVFRRGPGPQDFTPMRERVIAPNGGSRHYAGPVAVLTGRYVMSSCEAFLLMMKQCPRATLVGEKSYGSSGNPKPVFLPNGVRARIPSWKAMLPDGTCFEGKGIEPDIEVPSAGVDFSATDPVLERAIAVLTAKRH